MHSWDSLLDVVVLLAGSLVLGSLMARLKQSALLGYLLAGTVLGPNGFNVIHDEKTVESIAELGVALLLFSLGLEFSWQRLKRLGGVILIGGFLQIAITVAIVTSAGVALSRPWKEAFVVGAMIALSSTACVLRVLLDRAEIESAHGRTTMGILLVQDIAVVPLALAVNVMGTRGTAPEVALYIGQVLLYAAGLVVGLYLLLNQVAVRALGTLTIARNRELTILLAIVTGLGSAWAAYSVNLSPALGAFVAGMFLGSSPFAAQIRADIASLRIVLLTLFFSAAGMLGDPAWMFTHLPILLGLTAAVVLVNSVVAWQVLRRLGTPSGTALTVGICLAQMSEFAFVLGGLGKAAGVVSNDVFMAMASTAIVTLFITPFLIAMAPRLGAWLDRRQTSDGGKPVAGHGPGEAAPPLPDVVIVGFGPAGQRVGRSLIDARCSVVVIDQNPDSARIAGEMRFNFVTGDASTEEVLEHARAEHAKVVVITLPTPSVAMEVLRHVRRQSRHTQIVVRARYHMYAGGFEAGGANEVVDEEEEVGKRLAFMVRYHLGHPHEDGRPHEEHP
jgi:CPA2 family monovalent cation:H+ antiporter-2